MPKRKVPEKKNGRIVEVIKIMFPGYLFIKVKMNADVYHKIKLIPYVVNVLSYRNKKDIMINKNASEVDIKNIPDEEMMIILRMINKKDVVEFSKIVKMENRLRIISGPLKGLEDKIKKIDRHKHRIKLSLDFMGSNRFIDLGADIIISGSEENKIILNRSGGSYMYELKSRIEDMFNQVLELPQGSYLPNEISNIGINSLAYVKLIVNLESTFGIEISDEYLAMGTFSTIDEIVSYIENLL